MSMRPPYLSDETAPRSGGEEGSLALSFKAEVGLVEGILTLAEEWAAKRGVYKDDRTSLRLVLEELLLNLCLHARRDADDASPGIELAITPMYAPPEHAEEAPRQVRRLAVTLRDTGPEFNPLLYNDAEIGTIRDTAPGGRGLTLVRMLAADIEYARQHGTNLLRLTLACAGPGKVSPCGDGAAEEPFSGSAFRSGGILRSFARLWSGRLAVRQAAFFLCISMLMLWGGLLFCYLAVRDARNDGSRAQCLQALHTQNISSSTFLERLAVSFAEFAAELEELPEYAAILESDEAFFQELRDGVLLRTVTADTAVLGVLKGERGKPGAMLLYRTGDMINRLVLPMDFGPFVEKSAEGDRAVWVGPIHTLPEEVGQGHAGMLLGTLLHHDGGETAWVGLVITMPWIAATLDALSGFENTASVFVSDRGEYVVYPPGRNVRGGPQALGEEAGGDAPEMARLLEHIGNRETGMTTLERLFPGDILPWPLPWQGPTTLAYAPMDIPGWSFLLLVSSEEIGATPPSLPGGMILLALFAPFCIAAIAWKVSSAVVRPLDILAGSLQRIADGDLDTPLPASPTRDEISDMLRAFEHVRVTLKHSFANLAEATAAEQRMRNELALARAIQESMLPVSPPDVPGVRVATSIDMAGDVCGDLFDCFTLPGAPDVLYCVIGDVCGKGIPASVVMSRAMVLARSILLSGATPARTLARLNEALLRSNDSLMFVTMLVVRLDGATGECVWASAGHPPPMPGPVSFGARPRVRGPLPWSRDLVLGVRPGVRYAEYAVALEPGQSMLLYTDGAEEAMSPALSGVSPAPGQSEGMDIFGEEKLRDVFFTACEGDEDGDLPRPADVLNRVRGALLAHMRGTSPFDDTSLIVVRWDGATQS